MQWTYRAVTPQTTHIVPDSTRLPSIHPFQSRTRLSWSHHQLGAPLRHLSLYRLKGHGVEDESLCAPSRVDPQNLGVWHGKQRTAAVARVQGCSVGDEIEASTQIVTRGHHAGGCSDLTSRAPAGIPDGDDLCADFGRCLFPGEDHEAVGAAYGENGHVPVGVPSEN